MTPWQRSLFFEDLPFLGWKESSPPRKLASPVLITPEEASNTILLLLLPFPLHPALGHFFV